ncbi:phosphoribosyltransferase [Algoriphagus marinus]|uniref:phosphoribosyltransferase n=1 Tax=Algoriphagus marinus TaxID=1925762 RepID=UPI00094B9A3A|nr:phosphoribosyltransferase family protein [Algoriphagus marinus]
MKFKNRDEAALLLAEKLNGYKDGNAVVLAIPRGGVPLGYVIAKQLDLPLEIVLSKKIGHPNHKEYAIGAVTLKSRILSEAAKDVSKNYIESETEKIRENLRKRHHEFCGDKKELNLQGKILIVVDDGIATGNTILSTVEMLHDQKPDKIVIAVPVSPPSAIINLQASPFVDEVICLFTPFDFRAVGQFYEDFGEVNDEQVKQFLELAN